MGGSRLAAAGPKGAGPIAVRASRAGFTPASISLRRGEAARLELTAADAEHCFAVDALRIEKRIVPGKTTTLDLTPDRVGTFAYYCCLESGAAAEKERGKLIVTE